MARTLTEEDIQAIGVAISQHQICALGLNAEDAAIIKNHLGVWKKARNVVGNVILTAIGTAIVAIVTLGLWHWLKAFWQRG